MHLAMIIDDAYRRLLGRDIQPTKEFHRPPPAWFRGRYFSATHDHCARRWGAWQITGGRSPFLTFPPFQLEMQPGATLPDCTPEPARTDAGAPSSRRSPVVGPRDEHAAVTRLRIGALAHRNGRTSVA